MNPSNKDCRLSGPDARNWFDSRCCCCCCCCCCFALGRLSSWNGKFSLILDLVILFFDSCRTRQNAVRPISAFLFSFFSFFFQSLNIYESDGNELIDPRVEIDFFFLFISYRHLKNWYIRCGPCLIGQDGIESMNQIKTQILMFK